MRNRVFGIVLAAGLLILSGPLVAHHGSASFDTEKELTLKGTVTEWLWANPHCFLKIDVKDEAGAVTPVPGLRASPKLTSKYMVTPFATST